MSDKFKAALLFFVAMTVLLCGGIAMVVNKFSGWHVFLLLVWAVTYGGLLAGSAHYDVKTLKFMRP